MTHPASANYSLQVGTVDRGLLEGKRDQTRLRARSFRLYLDSRNARAGRVLILAQDAMRLF